MESLLILVGAYATSPQIVRSVVTSISRWLDRRGEVRVCEVLVKSLNAQIASRMVWGEQGLDLIEQTRQTSSRDSRPE